MSALSTALAAYPASPSVKLVGDRAELERIDACLRAMAGIPDPEAFVRNVRIAELGRLIAEGDGPYDALMAKCDATDFDFSDDLGFDIMTDRERRAEFVGLWFEAGFDLDEVAP